MGNQARVTRLAVDGSTTGDVLDQLDSLPSDVTHIAVSAGGNDILHHVALLEQSASSVAEVVGKLSEAQAELRAGHFAMAAALSRTSLPVAICTIYDANYEQPKGALVATAMSIFNDVITRSVHLQGLDLLDLRLVCQAPEDFANPIEPSASGGAKIARLIAKWANAVDLRGTETRVFV